MSSRSSPEDFNLNTGLSHAETTREAYPDQLGVCGQQGSGAVIEPHKSPGVIDLHPGSALMPGLASKLLALSSSTFVSKDGFLDFWCLWRYPWDTAGRLGPVSPTSI